MPQLLCVVISLTYPCGLPPFRPFVAMAMLNVQVTSPAAKPVGARSQRRAAWRLSKEKYAPVAVTVYRTADSVNTQPRSLLPPSQPRSLLPPSAPEKSLLQPPSCFQAFDDADIWDDNSSSYSTPMSDGYYAPSDTTLDSAPPGLQKAYYAYPVTSPPLATVPADSGMLRHSLQHQGAAVLEAMKGSKQHRKTTPGKLAGALVAEISRGGVQTADKTATTQKHKKSGAAKNSITSTEDLIASQRLSDFALPMKIVLKDGFFDSPLAEE
eukprot:TRINITY_DN6885_c0_g1_i1.p1 TRINITY_DN6885_c0_g1~~TRINITY_DN6885_c0_g1_i1.p1  ORF type:complete len:268 (-),score=62.45 TRINITY_DN6885_c0_g1_i1:197-1000(-)